MNICIFLFTLLVGGFGTGELQKCKDAGVSTKQCVSDLWEQRKADYSQLNG